MRAKPSRLVAGLMTGTSMDGLDIAVCEVAAGDPGRFTLIAEATAPFPSDLREALLPQGELDVGTAARLGRWLGEWYAAQTLALARREALSIDLVGLHGQTIHHEHGLVTVQIGEPGFLAAALGCPVVSGFRTNDVAVGGCGAPLVPIVDLWTLGRTLDRPGRGAVAINLGGIANITTMMRRSDGGLTVSGFDCGPANMVLDELARRASGGRLDCDREGAMAARGRIDETLVGNLLAEPFFAIPPPRSAGREDFGVPYVDRLLERVRPAGDQAMADLMASCVELSARAIAHSIGRFVAPLDRFDRAVAAGGGTRNPIVMERLAANLAPTALQTSDAIGLPAHLKEAIAFALLGSARVDEIPANVPEVTGARAPALLGHITEV